MRTELRNGTVDIDIRNFNYLMRALGAQGKLEECLAVMSDIRAAGLSPDVKTYNALLYACSEIRNPEAAWEVINVMQEAGMRACTCCCERVMQWCSVMFGDVW